MLRESVTYVIARNEMWKGPSTSEPVDCGWAEEAVFFVRLLNDPTGQMASVRAQISPDGMRWLDEGTSAMMPTRADELCALRVRHFGNWLRLVTDLPDGSEATVLITVHLK